MKLGRIFATLILILTVAYANVCSAAALKYGDRGDEVKEVQTYLIAQNLLQDEADGVYGASTAQAIKDFQTAMGLDADGVCGTITFKVLKAAAFNEIDIYNFSLNEFLANNGGSSQPVVEAEDDYAAIGDVIKPGMRGEGVVDLQNKLIEHGFLDGEADGYCGASTVSALKDFQRSRGMTADGICGLQTYSALEDSQYDLNDNSWDEYSSDVPHSYSRVIEVEATAYSRFEDGMSHYTATGEFVRRGIIATDPNVIPLGTRVYIPGYGYAIAADTGGAIQGHIIDVAMESIGECYQWGRRFVEVYILE